MRFPIRFVRLRPINLPLRPGLDLPLIEAICSAPGRVMQRSGAALWTTVLLGSVAFAAGNSPPARTFDIREFGAKGDGKTINTVAIQTAVNRCCDAGGGIVVIPAGIYLRRRVRLS
jgi:hypothetical protein